MPPSVSDDLVNDGREDPALHPADALTFVLTAVVTVCFDLIEAVQIGIVIAAVFALRSVARRSSVTREELPGPHHAGDARIALLRLDGAMGTAIE